MMVEAKGDLLIGITMLVKRISRNISPITMVIIYGYIYPAIAQYNGTQHIKPYNYGYNML